MTVGSAVRSHLAAELSALVGSRVYQLKLPQDAIFPAVRVALISEPRAYHLRGHNALTAARVQTDVFVAEASGVDPHEVADALADAVDAALSGRKLLVGDRRISLAERLNREPTYEGDALRLVRIRQDYNVVSQPVSVEG